MFLRSLFGCRIWQNTVTFAFDLFVVRLVFKFIPFAVSIAEESKSCWLQKVSGVEPDMPYVHVRENGWRFNYNVMVAWRPTLITRTLISHRLNYAYRTALIKRTEGRPNNAYRRYDY